jgi:hypothetical protein
MWSVIENFSAVICACVLCVRPLITLVMTKVFRRSLDTEEASKGPERSLKYVKRLPTPEEGLIQEEAFASGDVKMNKLESVKSDSDSTRRIYDGFGEGNEKGNMTKVWITGQRN